MKSLLSIILIVAVIVIAFYTNHILSNTNETLMSQVGNLQRTLSDKQRVLDLAIEFGYDPIIVQTTQHFAGEAFAARCTDCLTWRFIKDEHELTYFLLSIIQVESGGNVRAVGDSGKSLGLGQIQLPTARQYEPNITERELLSIEPQLRVAVSHFVDLLTKYNGNYALATLAWNRGVGAVNRSIALGSSPDNGYAYKVFMASAHSNSSN